MTLREAAQQALEALETPIHEQSFMQRQDALAALRAALEQEQEQEPVAWIHGDEYGDACHWVGGRMPPAGTNLYTAPPRRESLTVAELPAAPGKCNYPDCVDNGPDGKCMRWLLGECGPESWPERSRT